MTELGTDPNYDLFKRQLGFYNPDEQKTDTVSFIGLGGIGSFAAIGVAKLGVPHIHIMDDDTIELHNIPNQFHPRSKLGMTKAHALEDAIIDYSGGSSIYRYEGRITDEGYTGESKWLPRGIVVSGVDSMASRMDIWNHGSIKFNPRVSHYVDARIAGQLIVIYTVNPNDLEDIGRYEATLHTDAEAVDAPCTERGVIDVGLTIGALITNLVRHLLTDGTYNPVISTSVATPPVFSGDWILPAE